VRTYHTTSLERCGHQNRSKISARVAKKPLWPVSSCADRIMKIRRAGGTTSLCRPSHKCLVFGVGHVAWTLQVSMPGLDQVDSVIRKQIC
ncbi:unnamed protein product, partial [Mycena citricolor]